MNNIDAHWPIFEHWVKEQLRALTMPEGVELVKWWYRYALAYNDYVDSLKANVMPDAPEGADQ